jgi:zinc protease
MRMGDWPRRAAAVAFGVVGFLATVTARADPPAPPALAHAASETIAWDPAIRRGVLANGLRYAVMHNATPAGGVSLRLGVAVGSDDDPDDGLGAAHFLEHMAFGASKVQLQADVEATFAAAGVAFGRDRNAETSLDRTVYKIDLPHGDTVALDLGFRWLRQVADGAQLTPDAVDRERGVILAERETRLSDLSQAADAENAFLAQGAPSGRGPTIGTRESIEGLTAAKLQAIYSAWYRPRNAVVVVVGDEPLDVLEARVRDAFGTWRDSGLAPARSLAAVASGRALDVLSLTNTALPVTTQVCRMQATEPPATDISSFRHALLSDIWSEILGARLSAANDASGGAVLSRTVRVQIGSALSANCLHTTSLNGAWQAGLAADKRLIADLDGQPPTDDELDAALKLVRSRLRGALYSAATLSSSDEADSALEALQHGQVAATPIEALHDFDSAVETVTPADVQAAFRRDWSGSGPLIAITSPQPLAADKVRQAWSVNADSSAAPVTAAAEPPAGWNYASFGRPGKVVSRQEIPEGDAVRITFANGVRLNFKQTDFAKDGVEVRVTFGAGRGEIAPADLSAAVVGGVLIERGGLGRNSFADVTRLFGESDLHVRISVGAEYFLLSTASSSAGLTGALQVAAAYVTDPGFNGLDPLLAAAWTTGFKLAHRTPAMLLGTALIDGVEPGSPGGLDAAEKSPAPTGADLRRILGAALANDPLEVTIVGDVDESQAIDAVARTFGALPPRKDAARRRADAWFLRYPQTPPATITRYHDGPGEKAAIALVWPLYVAEPSRRREEYALTLLALAYKEALLRRIRGDLGMAYAPEARATMEDNGDQGHLIAYVECSAADVDRVRAEMAAIGGLFAKGQLSDADIETVRGPYLRTLAQLARNNAFWAASLARSAEDSSGLDEILHMQADYTAITPAEVRKAAMDWLSRPSITVIVPPRPADPAPATAPGSKPQ